MERLLSRQKATSLTVPFAAVRSARHVSVLWSVAHTATKGSRTHPAGEPVGCFVSLDAEEKMKETAMRAKRLTVQERKDIFRALVTAQDAGTVSVAESRQQMTKQFDITDLQLRQIEEEGLEKEWPPLDEAVQEVG
jgi:hypothetical protein